jgi:hypothetical protein
MIMFQARHDISEVPVDYTLITVRTSYFEKENSKIPHITSMFNFEDPENP